MTTLGLCLLWSAAQATLLGLVAAVLVARPWRVGGSVTPLAALLAMALLTLCSLLPLPGWWPVGLESNGFPSSSTSALSQESSSAAPAALDSNNATSRDQFESEPMRDLPVFDDAVSLPVWVSNLAEELQSVRGQADERWRNSAIPTWVVAIFACGLALGLVRLWLGFRGAMSIRRQSPLIVDQLLSELLDVLQAELGIIAKVELRQANQLTSAATIGYYSPAILLPKQWRTWQVQELRAVLSHELAHIAHRDFAAQLLAQVGLVLHFYHPVVHWLSERMKLEQELAADAVAARMTGGHRAYMRVLASLALDHDNQTVGWPARAFLPTRHSFLRRLEMLRISKAPSIVGRRSRWMGIVAVALLALGLATLRPTPQMPMAQASSDANLEVETEPSPELAEPQTPDAVASNAYELRYLTNDTELIVGARPDQLNQSAILKTMFDASGKLFKGLRPGLQLSPAEVEQLVGGFATSQLPSNALSWYLRLKKPRAFTADDVGGKAITINGRQAIELPNGTIAWQPDERSLVINARAAVERFMAGRFHESAFKASKSWSIVAQEPVFVSITGKLARSRWQISAPGPMPESLQFLRIIAQPMVEEADWISLSAAFGSELRFALYVECPDASGVKPIQENLPFSLDLLKKSLRDVARSSGASNSDPALPLVDARAVVVKLTDFAVQALDNIKIQSTDNLLALTTSVSEKDFPGEFLTGAAVASRIAAERQGSMLNLRQLGIAMHNYHDTYRVFPQSAITQISPQQTPKQYPYSWRVALLPYIEQAELYSKYQFDQPWDSPANLEVMKKMPAIYRHPDAPADTTFTSYVVLSGPDTMFPKDKPASIRHLTDGTPNILMVVEAKTSIPWTKPEDFEYATDQPLPKIGYSSEGANVLMADGSTRFLATSIDEMLLRKMITSHGGEVIK